MRKLLTKQNALLYGGYAAFFVVCFMLFAYFTFPYDRVKSTIEQRGSQGAPGVETKLTIGELGPHFLTGVALRDVVYERKGATDTAAAKIGLDGLDLRVSPLSLFTGLRLNFGAEVGSGEIDGQYSFGSENGPTHVEAELDAVDLGSLGLGAFIGVPLKGTADGDIDLTLAPVPADSHGAINLTVDKLLLADSKTAVKVPGMSGGLTLATLDAGKLELKVTIKDGVATIERMESKGKDLELSGSGSIRLANPVSQSRADVLLSVKIDDKYKQQSERTKMMFELMEQNPITSAAKTSDGSLRFRLTGTLAALRPVPGGAAGPAGRASRARKKVPGPD